MSGSIQTPFVTRPALWGSQAINSPFLFYWLIGRPGISVSVTHVPDTALASQKRNDAKIIMRYTDAYSRAPSGLSSTSGKFSSDNAKSTGMAVLAVMAYSF